MKKRFSRSLISMVLCLAMVMGICVVPASASAREVLDANTWVDGTSISVRTFSDGIGSFSGELVVGGYDPNYEYSGMKVYGPAVGNSGETFKPGTYNAFPLYAPSSDYILELRIEFLISGGYVGKSITVSYDISKNTLTVLQPTSRTIIVDGVEIAFTHFDYYNESFYGEMYVDATKNPAYEPRNIVVEFSPNLDSTGGMPRPGPLASFSLNGRVGDVTNITFRVTLYDYDSQNAIQIYTTYDVTRNDFIHPPI
ncbi:hypothetical protein [Anaeromassilibacillus senegalensis]|uniref:hypothetical protein n=1 Tax=Anaeromassilibacillus senegalensis TaxID=1673717 RepID=UPI000681A314|nr:hypothetical protein [Anaeromassilibacillus senegalensis]